MTAAELDRLGRENARLRAELAEVELSNGGHVCDYVEPDGTTLSTCHKPGVHGGRTKHGYDGPYLPANVDKLAERLETAERWLRTMSANPYVDCPHARWANEALGEIEAGR